MIYPTTKAVLLAGCAIIVSLAVVVLAPGLWSVGFACVAFIVGLLAADAWLSPWPSGISVMMSAPRALQVGQTDLFTASIYANGQTFHAESRLETNGLIDVAPGNKVHSYILKPNRRGIGEIKKLWIRWRGPLGLLYKQDVKSIEDEAVISSDTRVITEEAIKILTRENLYGDKIQIDRGEGSEFDSLREFQAGMDSRAIDWKQTARHRTLLTREFRIEKNNSIIFAIDSGRLMSEPIRNGLSRLDHALNASLLMSFVSLKLGDRVGFFSFDAKPKLQTGVVSGPRAFTLLQKLTAGVDYSTEETNYTLGLTELSANLDRRSLIIIFTDFSDSTSAELMLTSLSALSKRHLILFVAFRDDELEDLMNTEPENAENVSRAVIADTLLRERDLVISKLQRMGAQIVDAPSERIGATLINQYIKIKNYNLL